MTVNQGESNDLLALEAPIASQVESTKVKLLVLFPFLSMLLSDHDTNGVKGVKNARHTLTSVLGTAQLLILPQLWCTLSVWMCRITVDTALILI